MIFTLPVLVFVSTVAYSPRHHVKRFKVTGGYFYTEYTPRLVDGNVGGDSTEIVSRTSEELSD